MVLKNILDQINNTYSQARDRGTAFEHLMIKYFENEPFYRDSYQEILPYSNWIENYAIDETKKDTGIDLVAVTKNGKFHAIQCKYRKQDNPIYKEDIDSFIAMSGKKYFESRIFVSTTNKISDEANTTMKNQEKPITLMTLNDLEQGSIDWFRYLKNKEIKIKPIKKLREHQQQAVQAVIQGFASYARGKMIMACGSGKTLTALHIARKIAGEGKRVLFLVPSLSLMSQTIREWTQNYAGKLNNYAVCSDSKVGKRKQNDELDNFISDLNFPATTTAKSLATSLDKSDNTTMTVIYCTYQSIDIIHALQSEYKFGAFDLAVCDEAHRTAGYTFDGKKDQSYFTRIHDNNYIQANKRLYMTATPKVYGEEAKKAEGVVLCSMDDEKIYGKEFYRLTFSTAVEQDLLVDYKVIILRVDESYISNKLNNYLLENTDLKVSDAGKIIGCWKALSGQDLLGGWV